MLRLRKYRIQDIFSFIFYTSLVAINGVKLGVQIWVSHGLYIRLFWAIIFKYVQFTVILNLTYWWWYSMIIHDLNSNKCMNIVQKGFVVGLNYNEKFDRNLKSHIFVDRATSMLKTSSRSRWKWFSYTHSRNNLIVNLLIIGNEIINRIIKKDLRRLLQ